MLLFLFFNSLIVSVTVCGLCLVWLFNLVFLHVKQSRFHVILGNEYLFTT